MQQWNVVVMIFHDWAHTTQLSTMVQLPNDQSLKIKRGLFIWNVSLVFFFTLNENVASLHSFLRNMQQSHTIFWWSYFPTPGLNNEIIQHKYIHQVKKNILSISMFTVKGQGKCTIQHICNSAQINFSKICQFLSVLSCWFTQYKNPIPCMKQLVLFHHTTVKC